jgi:tripartite-type tricarboxylate transporter receptor subunit TctC
VISGQVDMLFSSSIAILPHARTGRLRALGITSSQRNPTIPDLPTIAEAGVPGFESSSWSAMLAPARTPRPVLMRLNATLAAIAGSPDMKERAAAQGATLFTSSPEQARAFIKSEVEKWAKVIAAAGIRME